MHTAPIPVPPEILKNLTFEALPWDTHPIDIAHGSQGWGPFMGPWTPFDFFDPADNIDCTWLKGDNRTDYGPGYQDLTLFLDPSIGRVNNYSFMATVNEALAAQGGGYSNTIANGYQSPQAAPQISRMDKLRKLIGR